jgi:hypothetical protein
MWLLATMKFGGEAGFFALDKLNLLKIPLCLFPLRAHIVTEEF